MALEPAEPPQIHKEDKPHKRSSSRLLGGDEDEVIDEPFKNRSSAPYREPAPFAAPPAARSPVPKVLGGVGIMMALGKLPLLMTYLQLISDPRYAAQYQQNLIDQLATIIGLFALGVGLILS
jgi:hypothetical protein